jgi:hypothetical protein
MSIESFSPLPLNVFGTWVTLLDPSDVTVGMSPSLGDVEFFPGGVRTRAGLVPQFPVLAGTPQINGLKTYATTNLLQRLLALDSLGNIYKESSPGVLSLAASGVIPNALMASATQFGREYMAFSDGLMGQDLPRQYDDTNFDRVSQAGPAEGPTVADATTTGNISPGVHQCAVIFVTRQGFGPRLRRRFPGRQRAGSKRTSPIFRRVHRTSCNACSRSLAAAARRSFKCPPR